MPRSAQRDRTADAGFTLVELAVAMVVFGILVALTGTGWERYRTSQEHVSASRELVSVLRNAQMRATAEVTTYRVDVDTAARIVTVLRFDGAGYVQRTTSALEGDHLLVQEAGFRDSAGTLTTSAYFYARGTASPGRVVLGRAGADVERVVTVEGLTGRVSTT